MANSVREFDADKVENCKDDIDTLLVFAGLYSAVLSAFNVESYTYLIPDPNTQIISLLERIVAQTQAYTISSTALNSTSPPVLPIPKFTAPPWAIRVNGLWFASLIISLATASLSMLVKQWLREFIAVGYRPPEQRLRAHQYRKEGLEKWKVFEIAAVLPMLLQISLGLFFIGLCIFTAAIDQRMGLTSIPLVSGWAFFIVATTIAPLFSPRCPYKLPVLKATMIFMRTNITTSIRYQLCSMLAYSSTPGTSGSREDRVPYVPQEEKDYVNEDKDDKDLLLDMDLTLADDSLLPTMWEALKQRHNPEDSLAFITELLIRRLGEKAKNLSDKRLRCIPDLSVLSRRTWEMFMEMVADQVRRGNSSKPLLITSEPWLYNATLLLMSKSPYALPPKSFKCLQDLLRDGPGMTAALSLARWIHRENDGEKEFTLLPLADRLCPLYSDQKEENRESTLSITFMYAEILQPPVTQLPLNSKMRLFSVLANQPTLFENASKQWIIQDLFTFLLAVCHSHGQNRTQILGIEEALAIVVSFSDRLNKQSEAADALESIWRTPDYCYRALVHIARLGQHTKETSATRRRMIDLAISAFARSSEQRKLILRSTSVAQRIVRHRSYSFTIMDMVRFCALHLELFRHHRQHGAMQIKQKEGNVGQPKVLDSKSWADLWTAISAALQKYSKERTWTRTINDSWITGLALHAPEMLLEEDRVLAANCLQFIDSLENSAEVSLTVDHPVHIPSPLEDPAAAAPTHQEAVPSNAAPREPVVPNELVEALGLFILPEHLPVYHRLSRLQEKGRMGGAQAGIHDTAQEQSDAVSSSPSSSSDDGTIRDILRKAILGNKGADRVKGRGRRTANSSDSDSDTSSSSSIIRHQILRKTERSSNSGTKVKSRGKVTKGRHNAHSEQPPSAQRSSGNDAYLGSLSATGIDEELRSALRDPLFLQALHDVASQFGILTGPTRAVDYAARLRKATSQQPESITADDIASSSELLIDDDLLHALRNTEFRVAVWRTLAELQSSGHNIDEGVGTGGEED